MPRNTRNKNRYIPITHPMMQKTTRKLGKQQFMSKGPFGEPRMKNHEGKQLGRLSTWQKGINSLGKNDKRKGSQKLSLKMVRGLEGRRAKDQLFKDTPKWKVNRRFLKEETPKGENYEK